MHYLYHLMLWDYPHEEGIEIMKKFLNQREVKDISAKTLCDLATIILKNNFFEIGE